MPSSDTEGPQARSSVGPTLTPEGTYDARVLSFGDIRQGKRAFFLPASLDIGGQTLIKHIAGWPEGLTLLHRTRKAYEGGMWKIRVKHREHNGGFIADISIIEAWPR